jgi:hypothetical protein
MWFSKNIQRMEMLRTKDYGDYGSKRQSGICAASCCGWGFNVCGGRLQEFVVGDLDFSRGQDILSTRMT